MNAGWHKAMSANKAGRMKHGGGSSMHGNGKHSNGGASKKKSASTAGMSRSRKKSTNKALMPAAPSAAEQNDWRAESDLRTLAEAEKIKADESRLKLAQRKAIEQAKAAEANLRLVQTGA